MNAAAVNHEMKNKQIKIMRLTTNIIALLMACQGFLKMLMWQKLSLTPVYENARFDTCILVVCPAVTIVCNRQ